MNRRRTFTIASATAAALVGVLAVAGLPGGGAKADDSDGPRLGTAEVTPRTRVEQQSFGEELPWAVERNPRAWAVNRRVEVVLRSSRGRKGR